ncbi:glycosyltransferase family 2 protein [Propionivibrio dicarboxylicus]|uniref:Glycosyltransferase involved in cell wall bisynthesis n=1 Tax=Propionivibrio dicarboxylicus TaxID=83767 RepID=A0A1G8KZT5_9RHOO|nr:glycosyltransferase family 2 protein [Propionivibrio dicarboxylicus]SDI48922.1 Glycosyltransferase involved in cell wall bisynthesis [Propionivibrio dicarboxylicus]
MIPFSVVIISKNEAATIVPCLESVAALADEIVVLDSGSTDGTQAVCAAHGARVIETDWPGFGVQKQRAVDAARNDWVLCLDADERLSPELAASLRQALAVPQFQAFRFARANRFLGRYLRHGEGYPDWSLRLFDRRVARWSADAVHEKVLCETAVGTLAGDLLHDSAETLESYLTKQNRYTSLAAGMADPDGRPVSAGRLIASPLLRFIKFYVVRGGFLDGLPGLVHIAIGCFNSFVKYAKIRERQLRRG